MGNPNDDARAQLARDWPHWEVWVVHNAVGPPTWCARRRDDHKKVISADSAGHLAEYLEDTVSEPVDHGWVSGTCGTGTGSTACTRCGQPKPADGNDWCERCENENAAEALAALRGAEPEIPRLDQPMTGALLRELFPSWTIVRDEALGAWTAEKRDGNELHFLAAIEAWELAERIRVAERDDES